MKRRFEVVVIGGGPAGVAAALAASTKRSVALIDEQGTAGGASLEQGLIKSYAQAAAIGSDFDEAVAAAASFMRDERARQPRKHSLQAAGVAVYSAHATFTSPRSLQFDHDQLEFGRAVIASGAQRVAPSLAGNGQIWLPSDLLTIKTLPKRLIILGADDATTMLSKSFTTLGSRVSVISDQISSVEKLQRSYKLNFVSKSGPTSATAEVIMAAGEWRPNLDLNPAAAQVEADDTGIKVNQRFQTSNKAIFAIGACIAPRSPDDAATQGSLVGLELAKNRF